MEKGGFVLLGVVLTLIVTLLKEWRMDSIKKKRERDFISIHLIFMLDNFTFACANVVNDDGFYMGQRDKNGHLKAQVAQPDVETEKIPGDWKSLDAPMIYDIHKLGIQKINADDKIKGSYDYVANPPDYDEYFEERQYQYCLLGKESDRLATKLRQESGMPPREWGEFNPIDVISNVFDDIEDRRRLVAERHKAIYSELLKVN